MNNYWRKATLQPTRLKILILLAGLSFISATYAENQCSSEKLEFLLGDWQVLKEGKIYTESWQLDSTGISGTASIAKQDANNPHFTEAFRFITLGNRLYYVVKTPDNALPIVFEVKNCQSTQLELTNPQHDFPQLIKYHLNQQGQLVASVGTQQKIAFKTVYQKHQASEKTTELESNVKIVKEYLALFNQKAKQLMLSKVTADIRWWNFYENQMNLETEGKVALGEALDSYFASTSARSVLQGITAQGDFVSATEKVFWENKGKVQHQCSPVVYQIENGLIKQVWYYAAFKC
jgi:hypothetical protein